MDIGGLSGPDGFLEAVALLRSLKFAFPSARALVIKVREYLCVVVCVRVGECVSEGMCVCVCVCV